MLHQPGTVEKWGRSGGEKDLKKREANVRFVPYIVACAYLVYICVVVWCAEEGGVVGDVDLCQSRNRIFKFHLDIFRAATHIVIAS